MWLVFVLFFFSVVMNVAWWVDFFDRMNGTPYRNIDPKYGPFPERAERRRLWRESWQGLRIKTK